MSIGPQAAPPENNKVNSGHMFLAPLCLAPVVQLVPKPRHLTNTGLMLGSFCVVLVVPPAPKPPHLTKTSLMLGAPWPLVPDANCPRMNPIEMNDPPKGS